MKNILSYKEGSIFTGQEINEWCIAHQDLHVARVLLRKKYKDDRLYKSIHVPRDSGCGSRMITIFERADKYDNGQS